MITNAGYECGFYFIRATDETPIEQLKPAFEANYRIDFKYGSFMFKRRER